jgi:F5/8 type C domain
MSINRLRAAIECLERRTLFSVNILVHHGDAANDGANLAETVLTPANVNPTDFGKRFSTTLDAPVYAQPLYVQNVDITRGASQGMHSVVYVVTMHDSLYAIDANSGAILWQDSFLNTTDPTSATATTGVTTVPTTDLGSTNLGTELGILATPAIDLNRGEIFLNANTEEVRGTDDHFVQRLWGVSLANGAAVTSPAVIGDTISNNAFYSFSGYQYVSGPIVAGSGNNADPTTYPNNDGWTTAPGGATTPVIAFNALIQMERTGVTLLNGSVYLGFASHGDNGPYYGWILGYSESTLAINAAFVTTPTYEGIVGDRANYTAQGGIWASGSAIATDGTYLYVLTGNGAFNTAAGNFEANGFPIDHDYADSMLKLQLDPNSSPGAQNGNGWGLSVNDYFTPSNAEEMNTLDLDLGSGGVLLLPDSLTDAAGNPMIAFGGKESRLYLLDRDNLGKFNYNYPATGNPDPRLYDQVLGEYAGDGINGGSNGIYSTPAYYNGQIYYGQDGLPAQTFAVSTFASGTVPPGVTYTPTPLQQTAVFGYPDPTFTVSANGSTNGVIWGLSYAASDLQAFDAGNFTTPIYDSKTTASDAFATPVKFAVPTVANGMVYFANKGTFFGYGLRTSYLTSDPAYFSAPTKLTISAGTSGGVHLSWTSNSSLAGEFRIDRSTNNSTWTTLAYVSNSVTTDDDPTSGNYYYRVAAISGASATPASNVVTLIPANPPLTGKVIGTSGSYKSQGNTIAKAFDGSLKTFFDGPTASGDWAGLDLGSTKIITQIKYASRSGWASRMNGGIFQGSNSATFASGVINLYTIPAGANPSSTSFTSKTITNTSAFRYVRYLGPTNSYGDVAEIQFFGKTSLTGTLIGTSGAYQNDGNTIAKAVDGNLSTFFDGPTTNGDWVGLDLGTAKTIKQISYAPRSGWASRMVGGVFQASNSANFSNGVVTLYKITTAPTAGVMTTVSVSDPTAYRYFRYLSPNGGYGNIAELAFFG